MLGPVPYLAWIRDASARARYSLANSGARPPAAELSTDLSEDAATLVTSVPGEVTRRFEAAVAQRWGALPPEVVAAPGTTGANFLCMAALLSPGDEVLIERPVYGPLADAARGLGARVRWLPRPLASGHQPDLDVLRRLVGPRTRLVVLTCPHNPSGAVLDEAVLEAVLSRVEDQGRAWVLLDAVYRELCDFSSEVPIYPPSWRGRRLLVTASLTKAYGLPDLRAGWVVAPERMVGRLRAAADHFLPGAPGPAWHLAARVLEGPVGVAIRGAVRRHLDEASTTLLGFLDRNPDLSCHRPPLPFMIFPKLPRTAPRGGVLCERLLEDAGVLVVPGRFFGDDDHVRLAAFAPVADLCAGLSHLEKELMG